MLGKHWIRVIKCTVKQVQWSPSITDTTGTKHFVLYSEVSFAQGVIVDHAPLTFVASYAGARLWTMKSVVFIKDLNMHLHVYMYYCGDAS